jgi:hypothetical protein
MKRNFALLLMTLTLGACTERLTIPGGCPELCPGGPVTVRDTFLDAIPGLDSAFVGYGSMTDGASLLLANSGGELIESVALLRFIGRGDTVIVQDTTRTFVVDSVRINIALQDRDDTVEDIFIDVYRLPVTFDTLATYAEMIAAMVPGALLKSVPVPVDFTEGSLPLNFTGAELSKFNFVPLDSTRLVLGLRLRAPSQAGAYVGSVNSGASGPVYTSFVTVNNVTDTILRKRQIARSVARNATIRSGAVPFSADLLQVGGFPAARSLIRFNFPEYLKDSVTILRATLELVPNERLVGIPGDSARVDVRTLLADFGAKSPIVVSAGASSWMRPGDDTVRIDIGGLVSFWQGGANALPAAVRVNHGQEFASFIAPRFKSTRSTSGAPRLRITYRPRFAFGGF